ncbi:hypothetical protein K505DRAFT_321096 [Melanomma pulvis-pyrius CBS 109.77]|uniref:Uncharacterized protein n=1 Tax=Melanomma pulvis-pyrius CBS 109.77 TaxID=1314802 RepID=A0A6A6XVA3_9PLEO|nr:hypothetical protein K505DRAFT_321096 [Melanomma pulvis-pyrius CBS 109.77]
MPPTQLSAIHPSPKRKRDQPAHVPLLNTTLRIASTPPRGSPAPSSGADSPRNAVADQLQGMSIQTLAIPMSPLTPTDDMVRKKPKLEAMRGDSGTSLEDFTDSETRTWELEKVSDTVNDTVDAGKKGPRRIPGSPRPTSQLQSQSRASQPRIFAELAAFAQPTMFTSPSTEKPVLQFATSNHASKSRSRSSQPRQRNKSPSPPRSSLTWQDSEITGHLIDPSRDPEDDGTGLNGIGFKPTPALAYARAQRRRQQLMDWRAREAKEARAKRSERRRRGVRTGTVSREVTVEREVNAQEVDALRRTVKFAM